MVMTDMQGSIDLFLNSLTVNGMSQNTIRAYKADLKGLMKNVTIPEPMTYETTTGEETVAVPITRTDFEYAAAAHLTERRVECAPSTINRKLSCFRKFGAYLGWQDFLSGYKPPKAAKGVAHPLPEGVSGIMAMVAVARKPEHKAIVALCGMLGLRMGEALKVRPSDINTSRNMLRVHGKGDKYRDVNVSDAVWEHLMPAIIKARDTNALLIPLHDRTARRAWTSMAKRAGLSHSSSHDGRMTVGTTMYYNSGGDIRAVQEHLGHASSHTTENYTQVDIEKLRKAADIFGGSS